MKIIEAVPTIVALTLVFNNSSVSIDFNYLFVSEVIHVSSCKKTSVSHLETIDFMTKKPWICMFSPHVTNSKCFAATRVKNT